MPHIPGAMLFDHLRGTGRELARALRGAAKRPTFSLAAIATLAIGIGASTATSKRQELALRVWLGATQRRLLLLAFNDALVVSATGAVLGVAVAYSVVRLVVAFASSQLPRADAIEVNSVTLAFAVALALVATAAFAIVAVYGQQRAEGSRALQAATRGGTGTGTARRTQRTMVVVQVTLAVSR